jgi:hypothetical protein
MIRKHWSKGGGVPSTGKDRKNWVKSPHMLTWTKLLNDFKDGIIYIELDFIQYLAFSLTLKNLKLFQCIKIRTFMLGFQNFHILNITCSFMPKIQNMLRVASFISIVHYITYGLFEPNLKTSVCFSSSLFVKTQPPIQCVLESFPGGKARPGRDADYSSASSDEVRNK